MDDTINIEVISRLERLEARMRVLENRPAPEPAAIVPYNPDQTTELESLRSRIELAENKLKEAGSLRAVRAEQNLEDRVEARVEDVRNEIESDLANLNRRTIAIIERGVDDRIGQRTLPIEKVVRAQAKAIEEMREHIGLLENHLQRLIGTVERLVGRPAPAAAQPPTAREEQPGFRSWLDHAVNNEPIPAPPSVDPLFRPRIIKEEKSREKSPRRPMSPTA
jgi:hypothetical protein